MVTYFTQSLNKNSIYPSISTDKDRLATSQFTPSPAKAGTREYCIDLQSQSLYTPQPHTTISSKGGGTFLPTIYRLLCRFWGELCPNTRLLILEFKLSFPPQTPSEPLDVSQQLSTTESWMLVKINNTKQLKTPSLLVAHIHHPPSCRGSI